MTCSLLSMVNLRRVFLNAFEMLLKLPFLLHALLPKPTPPKQQQQLRDSILLKHGRTMEDFVREVTRLFEAALHPPTLLAMSNQLQVQFRKRLQDSSACMLPSYNHTLPSGDEKGTVLALDVGGSTLRVALVELCGRQSVTEPMRILEMQSWRIDSSTRALKGDAFFDWIAARISEMLKQGKHIHSKDAPLPIGLTWSFPVE
jgi:hexokinase